MTTMRSAIHPLHVAIDEALSDEGGITAPLFAGEASPKTQLPYVVMADFSEGERNMFARGGSTSTCLLHIWAKTHSGALALYGQLYDKLHRVPISVAGHTLHRGTLRLIGVMLDPGGASHGIAEYKADTVVADILEESE